jgi:hypothetical protein
MFEFETLVTVSSSAHLSVVIRVINVTLIGVFLNANFLALKGLSRNIGIVAGKIDEIISAENPPNCAGGIREFNCTCYIVSRLTAPYEIHSSSVNIA